MTDISYKILSWQEEEQFQAQNSDLAPSQKITVATVTKQWLGTLTGEGYLTYVMAYAADGSATFTGAEKVVGTMDGKQGSFLLTHTGTFKDGIARSTFEIIDNSGTDDLKPITGQGQFSSGHAQIIPVTFDIIL